MAENTNENVMTQENLSEILQVRRDKLKELMDNGKNPYEITKFDRQHYTKQIKDNYSDFEGKTVVIAGRLMSKRGMGKASFCDLADLEGRIQLYIRKDEIGEESYADVKKYDIGDIVGVTGEVFTTHMGEISVKVK